jgi:hypothetical protein
VGYARHQNMSDSISPDLPFPILFFTHSSPFGRKSEHAIRSSSLAPSIPRNPFVSRGLSARVSSAELSFTYLPTFLASICSPQAAPSACPDLVRLYCCRVERLALAAPGLQGQSSGQDCSQVADRKFDTQPRPALAADRYACKRGALGRLGCWGRLRSRAPLTIPCPLRACVNASVEPGQLTEYS